VVFSNEVGSTVTAMNTRTLLSDHVCTEDYSYPGTLTFQKKNHTRAGAHTQNRYARVCERLTTIQLSLLTRVLLGNLTVAVLSITLLTVYRLEKFTSVTNIKLFTPEDTTLKQFLQNHILIKYFFKIYFNSNPPSTSRSHKRSSSFQIF